MKRVHASHAYQRRGLVAAIEALCDAGRSRDQIIEELGADPDYVEHVIRFWRYERNGKASLDQTVPRFADHLGHVAACMERGGFASFSELRRPGREPVAVMPLVWPEEL